MKTSTITTTALSFAVVAALLTGCSATKGDTELVPTSKPAASSAPDKTDAPAPTEVKTGDVVDAAGAEAVKAAGNGQRAYPMADGTFVIVTKTEPLPAAVQADADAKATSTFAPYKDVAGDMNGSLSALSKTSADATVATGKRVVLIVSVFGFADRDAETKSNFWTVTGGPGQGVRFGSLAEAQATVDAWLASQDNSSEYAVINAG